MGTYGKVIDKSTQLPNLNYQTTSPCQNLSKPPLPPKSKTSSNPVQPLSVLKEAAGEHSNLFQSIREIKSFRQILKPVKTPDESLIINKSDLASQMNDALRKIKIATQYSSGESLSDWENE